MSNVSVSVDFHFEAAHRLPNVPAGHRCARMHGHSYAVRVEVTGEPDPVTGFVVDYFDVERAWPLRRRVIGETTGIGWTDHTANFWMGCQRVSPGCEHCYAETLVNGRMGLPVWGPASTTRRQRAKGVWKDVPRWNREAARDGVRRRLFVSSLADIFEDHPDVAPWRAEALALLETCTALDVQLLTKRPENIRAMVPAAWLEHWPAHVWVGCTVESQEYAERRIPHLLAVPAAVRFLSCEPLLEAVNLRGLAQRTCRACTGVSWEDEDGLRCPRCGRQSPNTYNGLAWVIVGGESGPRARPFDLTWARSIVAQCREAGVPVFVKQAGDSPVDSTRVDIVNERGGVAYVRPANDPDGAIAEARKLGRTVRPHAVTLRAHHGADPREWPEDLRVQQFPEVPRG